MRLLVIGAALCLAAAPLAPPFVIEPGYTVSVVTDQVFFPGPSGIDLAPDGSLIVATGGVESVYFTPIIRLQIDGTYAMLGDLVRDPDGIAVAPDGTVYVGARNGVYKVEPDGVTTLLAIDPANVGKKFPTGGLLWQADYLALNPVNGELYSSGAFGAVVKIDTTTGAYQVLSTEVSGGVACSPSGQLYVASRTPGNYRLVKLSPAGVATTVADLSGFMAPAALVRHEPSCTWYITTKGPQIIKLPPGGPPSVFGVLPGAQDLVFSADGKTMFATDALAKTVYRVDGFPPATTQPLGYDFPEAALATGGFEAAGAFVAAGIEPDVYPMRPDVKAAPYAPYNDDIVVKSGGDFRMVGTSTVWGSGLAGGAIDLKGNSKILGGVMSAAAPTGLPVVPWNPTDPSGSTTISGDVEYAGPTTLWFDGDLHITGTLKATGTLVIYVKGNLTIDGDAWVGRWDAPYDTHVLMPNAGTIKLSGKAVVHGTIYAPAATVALEGGAILHGAVVAGTLKGGAGASLLSPPGGGGIDGECDCD